MKRKDNVIAYVFDCGHVASKPIRGRKRMSCPICYNESLPTKTKLIARRCKCLSCGKDFIANIRGFSPRCPECIGKNRPIPSAGSNERKEEKVKPSYPNRPEIVHNRTSCLYRTSCLTGILTYAPYACTVCVRYQHEATGRIDMNAKILKILDANFPNGSWRVQWLDTKTPKWFLAYEHIYNNWIFSCHTHYQVSGIVYMNEKAARLIRERLKSEGYNITIDNNGYTL